jgi:hypothetical protein
MNVVRLSFGRVFSPKNWRWGSGRIEGFMGSDLGPRHLALVLKEEQILNLFFGLSRLTNKRPISVQGALSVGVIAGLFLHPGIILALQFKLLGLQDHCALIYLYIDILCT